VGHCADERPSVSRSLRYAVRQMTMRTPAIVLCLLALTGSVRGDDGLGGSAPAPAPTRSPFWRSLSEPSYERADKLVRHGRALLYPALGLGLLLGPSAARERRLAIEAALSRFERALTLAPDHREARLLHAKALASWQERTPSGQLSDSSAQAIEQLHALRALDALYEAQDVAFQLGVLHTRRADFERARAEYEHALALWSDDDQASLLSNLAEVTMMTGDLTRALTLYERAVHESRDDARLLALWGSAVALDRMGEQTEALARARRATQEDRAPFAVLQQSGVFFAPPYERHYYEALGHLALADREREGSEPLGARVGRARRDVLRTQTLELTPLTDTLRALAEGPHASLAAALRARAARRQPHARVQASPAREKLEARPPSPAERELAVLSHALRALVSFELYLQADGGEARFAQDAREHIAQLVSALGPSAR
jgi:tetratricopeptide (TPR) repeat protein